MHGTVRRPDPAPWAVDATLGAALLLAGQSEVWFGSDGSWDQAALAALGTAPLVLWRRQPMLVLLILLVPLWIVTLQRSDFFTVAELVALMLATFGVALRCPRRAALAGLAASVATALANSAVVAGSTAGDYVFPVILLGGPWLAGRSLRLWHERARQLEALAAALGAAREESARLAASAERGKIARDLHDSLAQSLQVVVVQAEAAEAVLDRDPARVRESLHRIQEVGRAALTQTRQLLGVLRAPDDGSDLTVQPSVADLDRLVQSVRDAGLDVAVAVEGRPRPLPSATDVAVYRIIQESLTNVLKHARATRADVRLEYDADRIAVTVTNDGDGVGDVDDASSGFGLQGMRERSALLGGSLTARAIAGGGFEVVATLPIEGERG